MKFVTNCLLGNASAWKFTNLSSPTSGITGPAPRTERFTDRKHATLKPNYLVPRILYQNPLGCTCSVENRDLGKFRGTGCSRLKSLHWGSFFIPEGWLCGVEALQSGRLIESNGSAGTIASIRRCGRRLRPSSSPLPEINSL